MRLRWAFFGLPPFWPLLAVWLVSVSLVSPFAKTSGQQTEVAESADRDADATQKTQYATLTIDYGDGFQKRFVEIAWRDGMTVLDLMQAAKKHPRAGFDFAHQGRGANALLSKIDDVGNEGGGRRNWIYYLNEQKADRSFGICELQPGDKVLWRFEKYL